MLNVGTRWSYEVKPMPNQVAARIDVITKYVIGRSGIAGIQLHRENFSVGFSYDFPVIRKNTGNLGAFEFGLQLRRPVETRTRKKELAKRKPMSPQKKNPPKTQPKQSEEPQEALAKKSGNQIEIDSLIQAPSDSVAKGSTVQTGANAGAIRQEPLLVEKITLHFQFHYNSADLDDETEKFLLELSQTLKEDSALKIKIIGHTDNIGPEKFNQKLSVRRAASVGNFLIQQGIEPGRVEAGGRGMGEPVGTNDTEEGRAKNRRVELMVSKVP